MARSHARIFTAIWDDPDFLALTGLAQRCYLMLLSQPNPRPRRCPVRPPSGGGRCFAPTRTRAALRAAIAELAERRFVVVDERTEELLVRSLIRNDGVWKQPKVLAVAITEAASIRSAALRACVAEELGTHRLHRVAGRDTPDRGSPAQGPSAASCQCPSGGSCAGPSAPPCRPPSAPPCRKRGCGCTPCARAGGPPTPATVPVPSPVPPPAAEAADAAPETPGQRTNRMAKIYTDRVPISNFPAVAKIVRKAVDAKCSDEQVTQGLLTVISENWSLTTETLRRAIYGPPHVVDRKQQATDDMFDEAMERARIRDREANS